MKEKIKLVIAFISGLVISILLSVKAATVIGASSVSYTNNNQSTVEGALNNYYTNVNTIANSLTTLNTTVSNIGTVINATNTTTSIPSGTITNFGTLTLPKGGVYIAFAYAKWTTGFTQLDYIGLNSVIVRNVNVGSGGGASVTNIYDTTSAAATVYCRAYQISGSTRYLDANYKCYAVRIK